jgi:hypothetical protein
MGTDMTHRPAEFDWSPPIIEAVCRADIEDDWRNTYVVSVIGT